MIKLTEAILDDLIWEVIRETDEKEWCKNKPDLKSRKECEERDDTSRRHSAEKRQKEEETLPAHKELLALGKGIISEEEVKISLIKKFKNFNAELTPEERHMFQKSQRRRTTAEMFKWCSALQDASKGSFDDNQRDIAALKLKQQQQAQKKKDG